MTKDKKLLESYLDKLYEQRGYPGVAITIRGTEGVVFEKGFGFRDSQKNPVDENTMFGIASMSKSMTALACCILHTEGKLSLEDPVTKYFPELHIPGTPDECVTLKMIAMHRAGIPPMQSLEWSIAMNSKEPDSEWYRHMLKTAPNKMDKIEQVITHISDGGYRPLGAPGEIMSYSNEGYAILSYVVDKAAGCTLEEFLDERIFKPLGMSRTVLDLDCVIAKKMSGGNITSLFERNSDGSLTCDDDWSVLPPFRGCACVKSTSEDMSRYYYMLACDGMWEGKQIIPKEAVNLLAGEYYPITKEPFYCLGLRKRIVHDMHVCEHSGGLHGVSSFGGYTSNGYSVVVLCNEGDLDMEEFQWVCYNYVAGKPLDESLEWASPNGKTFSMPEALCGDFFAEEGLPTHCIVKYEDNILKAEYCGRDAVLKYCGGTVFAVFLESDQNRRIGTVRFFIRDGKAWAVRCYNRVYQRV